MLDYYIVECPDGIIKDVEDVRVDGVLDRKFLLYVPGETLDEARQNLLKTVTMRKLPEEKWPDNIVTSIADVRGDDGLIKRRDYTLYTSGETLMEAHENILKGVVLRRLTPADEARLCQEDKMRINLSLNSNKISMHDWNKVIADTAAWADKEQTKSGYPDVVLYIESVGEMLFGALFNQGKQVASTTIYKENKND